MKTEKGRLKLLVAAVEQYGTTTIQAHVVRDTVEGVRNVSHNYEDAENAYYEGLVVHCYCKSEFSGAKTYGQSVAYRGPFCVDAKTALRMHKTLSRINKALEAMDNSRGSDGSYAELVCRVAETLKAGIITYLEQKSDYDKSIFNRPASLAFGRKLVESIVEGATK